VSAVAERVILIEHTTTSLDVAMLKTFKVQLTNLDALSKLKILLHQCQGALESADMEPLH
jgi:hypothetical protein